MTKDEIFARRIYKLKIVSLGLFSAIVPSIWVVGNPKFALGFEVFAFLIGSYIALLGFVISASTSFLNTITQTTSKSAHMIFVSSQGTFEQMLKLFGRAKMELWWGLAACLIALSLNLSYSGWWPAFKAAIYGYVLYNLIRNLFYIRYVILELSDVSNQIAKDLQRANLNFIKQHQVLTTDQFVRLVDNQEVDS